MMSLAIMGLLPPAARVESGQILLEGDDLLRKSEREMQRIRGRRIAMVLQDPMTALDPSFTIRSQLAEPLQQHRKLGGRSLDAALVASLEQVHLSATKERLNQYPHQLSGGMRQRVTSAIALAGSPRLLIADEPTTALDVMVQAQVLRLLKDLQRELGLAMLFITHDLSVLVEVCDLLAIMYAGRIVEEGPSQQVFEQPAHPYTAALAAAFPAIGDQRFRRKPSGLGGDPPQPDAVPSGCSFHPRCPVAFESCPDTVPELYPAGDRRRAACLLIEQGAEVNR
jgi:peptide/nickel transport system ATP-binding protein